ncbi:MAG: trypsin-like peptidase domain-containing protein [Isosphaeraceae bacterium]
MTSLVVMCCLACTLDGLQQPPTSAPPAVAEAVTALENALSEAIARAERSVVAIHRDKGENPQVTQAVRGRKPTPHVQEPSQFDIRIRRPVDPGDFISFDYGSGVVVGEKGQILTAFHVVRGAERLRVRASGQVPFEAEVIAADPRSDLAVIAPRAIPGVETPRLKPLAIGDSARLRKGSFVVTLGNPFNAARDGSPSASWGIVSNLARSLVPEEDKWPTLRNYPTLLQLDAKLNLGMSGGAVINLKGELVGLTTTAASPAGFDAQAGYAIPMDKLGHRVVETLKEGKEVEYGLLGILSPDRTNRVNEVAPNSPASLGDLQIGDVIIAVNDVPIRDFDELLLAVNAYPAGEAIRLKILRSDKPIERTLVLAKFPVDGEIIATNRPGPWRGLRVDYLTQRSLRVIGMQFEERMSAGVVVTEVEEGSPAALAGLKKGQVIRRIGEQPVLTPRAFAEAVAKQAGPVTLDTDRGPVTVGH